MSRNDPQSNGKHSADIIDGYGSNKTSLLWCSPKALDDAHTSFCWSQVFTHLDRSKVQ